LHGLLVDRLIGTELREPLPRWLRGAQTRAHEGYLQLSRTVDAEVALDLSRLAKRRGGGLTRHGLVPQWQPAPFPAAPRRETWHRP
jgi:hypothetical protein